MNYNAIKEVFFVNNCLRRIRRERDESQEKLANAIGTSRQTIIGIEKGHIKRPSDELIISIAKHYNKDVKDIFFTPIVIHVLQGSYNIS